MKDRVGIVVVSHSLDVARGTVDMVRQMVGDEVPLAYSGGNPDGGLGTDVASILAAIKQVWSPSGVAMLVDCGDPRPALEHEGPLGRLVPVQLADAAGLEPHVDQGEVGGRGYLADRRLPRPAAFPHLDVAVGEGPSQGRQRATVCRRRPEPVWTLRLTSWVSRTEGLSPFIATDRLGRVIASCKRPGFGLPRPGKYCARGGRNRCGPC